MTRNASDCLLCHLTGLFGDQRLKEYDDWLLQEIEQTKGLVLPAVHFSQLHTGLNISTMWREQNKWQSLIDLRKYFDVLQIGVADYQEKQLSEFLLWNQKLDNPFRIFVVLAVQIVKDPSSLTIQDSYQRLRLMIEMVFSICKLPVDAISFENADFLWKETPDTEHIEPRNHYLLRHIRSAMDRIGAQQSLFIHSQGKSKDVNDYFSDGNNEVQIAGSVEMSTALIKCLQEGNTQTLVGITSHYRLNSLETAYFHTHTNISNLSNKQRSLANQLFLMLTGMPMVNIENLDIQSLDGLLNLRMNHPALHIQGAQIQLGSHEKIWGIQRYSMDMSQRLLYLANFSGEEQRIALGDDELVPDDIWWDLFTEQDFIAGQNWTLKPYQVMILVYH